MDFKEFVLHSELQSSKEVFYFNDFLDEEISFYFDTKSLVANRKNRSRVRLEANEPEASDSNPLTPVSTKKAYKPTYLPKLLTDKEDNPKIAKDPNSEVKYLNAVLHLLPYRTSGTGRNVCPFATAIYEVILRDNIEASVLASIVRSPAYERLEINGETFHRFEVQEVKFSGSQMSDLSQIIPSDPEGTKELDIAKLVSKSPKVIAQSAANCPELMSVRIAGSNRKDWENGKTIKIPRSQMVYSKLIGGCASTCLNTAGHIRFMDQKINSRYRKTKNLVERPTQFILTLVWELIEKLHEAKKNNEATAIRLNGTSDEAWESDEFRLPKDPEVILQFLKESWRKRSPKFIATLKEKFGFSSDQKVAYDSILPAAARQLAGKTIIEIFPETTFYDYTKDPGRMEKFLNKTNWPKNYFLIFSLSEHFYSRTVAKKFLERGGNVAVVFNVLAGGRFKNPLPRYWAGFPVIDADQHDFRFLDEPGTVAGLRAKGEAKHQIFDFGFVIQPEDPDLDQNDPAVQNMYRTRAATEKKVSTGKISPPGSLQRTARATAGMRDIPFNL